MFGVALIPWHDHRKTVLAGIGATLIYISTMTTSDHRAAFQPAVRYIGRSNGFGVTGQREVRDAQCCGVGCRRPGRDFRLPRAGGGQPDALMGRAASQDELDRLLADLAELRTRPGFEPARESGRIPRIVHMIWLGGKRSFGPIHYVAVRSAWEVQRPDQLVLYVDREPAESEWWVRARVFARVVTIRPPVAINGHPVRWLHHQADLLRLAILYSFGGIYLDFDMLSLRPVESLLAYRVVMAREGGKGLGNCAILARPGEPFIEQWLEAYRTRYGEEEDWWAGLSIRTPGSLARSHPEVLVLPQRAFMPLLYDDTRLFEPNDLSADLEDSFAVHLWETELSKTPHFPGDLDDFRARDNALTRLCGPYIDEFVTRRSEAGDGLRIGPEILRRGASAAAIACINLSSRPDRRRRMERLLAGQPVHFHTARPHADPVRGCLESHLAVLEWARSQRHEAVLVLEDDIEIVRDLRALPPFPEDWDMVYLGGLCTHCYQAPEPGANWVHGQVYCNHAYVTRRELYDEVLAEGRNYEGNIDHFLVHRIHPHRKAYVAAEPFVIQSPGWSDVCQRDKWQGFRWPRAGERFPQP